MYLFNELLFLEPPKINLTTFSLVSVVNVLWLEPQKFPVVRIILASTSATNVNSLNRHKPRYLKFPHL